MGELEQIVEDFFAKKDEPEKLKEFVNLSLGETWEERGTAQILDEVLAGRVEISHTIPEWVLYLTAGVDTQDNRLEVIIKGWGMRNESVTLDYIILHGSPGTPEEKDEYLEGKTPASPWTLLNRLREQEFQHPNGVKLKIVATGIDSGGHFTDDVYSYCKKHQFARVFCLKGNDGMGMPLVGKSTVKGKVRVNLYPVGSWTGTERILTRLQIDSFGPGYMHFNKFSMTQEGVVIADDEFFRQLTSYRLVTVYDKGAAHLIRKKLRSRREVHDAEIYAMAAKELLNPDDEAISVMMKEESQKEKGRSGTPSEQAGNVGSDSEVGSGTPSQQAPRRRGGWWIKP